MLFKTSQLPPQIFFLSAPFSFLHHTLHVIDCCAAGGKVDKPFEGPAGVKAEVNRMDQ